MTPLACTLCQDNFRSRIHIWLWSAWHSVLACVGWEVPHSTFWEAKGGGALKKLFVLSTKDIDQRSASLTMLGANLSDQIPGGLNLTLTLTPNSNLEPHELKPDTDIVPKIFPHTWSDRWSASFGPTRQLTLTSKSKSEFWGIRPDTDTDT